MRLANYQGRATLVLDGLTGVDVHTASAGRFGPELPAIFTRWDEFVAWAAEAELIGTVTIDLSQLGSPSPEPRQVFAVGLNYRDHAAESGFAVPDRLPPVFTKFPTSITGPVTTVNLPENGTTDWEVELVAVIGARASRVSEPDAWGHVAGLAVGQDLSERESQLAGPAPQFGLAKSFAGFSPVGPWLVTADEFANPDDLELGCAIDGETVQLGRTRELLFSIPQLVHRLSHIVTLLPGDLIFTGTPAGVGMGRTPQRFLQEGEVLRSWVEGIGELQQTFR